MADKPSPKQIWRRVRRHSGESFHTKTGLEFTYEVDGEGILPSRTDYRLSRSDLEEVHRRAPLDGPGEVSDIVRGSAYLWAIIHDERISDGER